MTNKPSDCARAETRREFLRTSAAAAAVLSAAPLPGSAARGAAGEAAAIAVVTDRADRLVQEPPVRWALDQLRSRLRARRIAVESPPSLETAAERPLTILVAGRGSPLAGQVFQSAGTSLPEAAESLGLLRGRASGREVLLASGADARGLVFAVLELADRVEHAKDPIAELRGVDRVVERPANPIRGVARYFTSDVEDKPWLHDRSFWQDYLSMLITQRFNRFSLAFGLGYDKPDGIRDSYLYFAYPFLVSVPGYDVRAVGLADEERERNLQMLRWISDEAAARGLHFQLALWTHAYEFRNSPEVNYRIAGLTAENHAAYCRDALHRLLEACPAIRGVTLRAHSESGIPEGSYDFWPMVFEGVARAGRRIEIDIHGKGIEPKLLDMALATGMPVTVSPKYWAEHMGLPYHQAAIRPQEWVRPSPGQKASLESQRRFTRYGYADYLREDRRYGVLFRIWPGTQRVLLWGDPVFAAGYGRYAHFCGSLGLELSEPFSFKGRKGSGRPGGRDGYADRSLKTPGGDWKKHAYTYRLWGRLLYNPDAPRGAWGRFLESEFGPAAEDCEAALAHASRVLPLITTAHLPSASNNSYWPELYTNMPIVDAGRKQPYGDTPSPKRFGTVSPLDPALFSTVEQFAQEFHGSRRSGKYSPLDVARWLEDLSKTAQSRLAQALVKVATPREPAIRRLAVDVRIQAGLGAFFAEKFRAAVAYSLFNTTGQPALGEEAMKRYRAARDAWAGLAKEAQRVYVDDITYGLVPNQRGHWADRLAAIDEDLADMERRIADRLKTAYPSPPTPLPQGERGVFGAQEERGTLAAERGKGALDAPSPARPACRHRPPESFRRKSPLSIELEVESTDSTQVMLFYRRVNQADPYQTAAMSAQQGRHRGQIPAEYTDSPYPLMYYFELRDTQGNAWLYPGLDEDLANQPYFVVGSG